MQPVPSSLRDERAGVEPSPMEGVNVRRVIRVDEASGGQFGFGPSTSTSGSSRSTPYPFSAAPPSWPAPPSRTSNMVSHFFETNDVMGENDGARWWKDKVNGRWEPIAKSKETFSIKDAMAVYSHRDRRFFLTKKSPGQVTFRKLPAGQRKHFEKARQKEIKALLDSGAITILSLQDSLKFMEERGDHVLESKFVDRWKPTEEFTALSEDFDPEQYTEEGQCGAQPKSRWCVVGWQDPMLHAIERSAPTPLSTSVNLSLQVAASRRWSVFIKDAKSAFTQALPTTRKQKLARTMPKDGLFPGCQEGQLILLHTEVYGLCSGPSWWRRTLIDYLLKNLGYTLNPYDRCVLTLTDEPRPALIDDNDSRSSTTTTTSATSAASRTTATFAATTTKGSLEASSKDKTRGVIVIQVDDLLEAGDEEYQRRMKALENRFRFGKVVKLQDAEQGTGYSGKRLMQFQDFSIGYTMNDYVLHRIKPVNVQRKVLKKDADTVLLNEGEVTQYRAALATLNWVAREGRPDCAAAASVLASRFPKPTIRDLYELNEVICQLKNHEVTLRIHPIAEDQVRHFTISDSSHDPSGRVKPQHGWLQGVTDPGFNRGDRSPVSIMAWRSRKLRRKAGNTLLCESIALSTALGALERQAAMWKSLTVASFTARHLTLEDTEEAEIRGQASVIASECNAYVDPSAVAVVDAKSLFDGVHSEQAQGEDDRSALEMVVIQESLKALKGRIRWIPHNRNPADGLTKLSGAHMAPLLELITKNSFVLEEEQGVLEMGKQSVQRLKSKV